MDRPCGRLACWVFAWLCVVSLASSVDAQSPRPQTKWGVWSPGPVVTSGHYGILGEIAQPGVYQAEQRAVTVQDLVLQAGGLTAKASPTFRLIRHQRAGQSIYFSPQGHDALMPGDVIIVDPMLPRQETMPPALTVSADGDVWVALIGVLDRPVIARMHGRDAAVGNIVSALGQRAELARVVRISTPPRQPMPLGPSAALPTGSVLVFDSNLLVKKTLPAFPEPYQFTKAEAALLPSPSSVAPQPAAPLPPSDHEDTIPLPSMSATEVPIRNAGSPRNTVDASTVPFITAPQAPAVAAPTSLPRAGSRLNSPVIPQQTEPKTTSTVRRPLVSADAEIVSDMETEAMPEGPAQAKSEPIAVWQMFGIGSTVAMLVGLSLLTRKVLGDRPLGGDDQSFVRPAASVIPPAISRRMSQVFTQSEEVEESVPPPLPPARTLREAQQQTIPQQLQEPHDLAEILAMQNDVETETPLLPRGLQITRTAPPQPTFRVDAAEELAAPHWSQPAVSSEPQAMLDAPAKEMVRAPHFLAARQPLQSVTEAAIIEPALSISPHAAPIERALQQLQGARS